MSVPKDHHYLPKWYLRRWSTDDIVWEFRRVGPHGKLNRRQSYTAGTGYQSHLYSSPDLPPELAATIERDFLQQVDDRGAKALKSMEAGRPYGSREREALVEFLCSMLHRSPGRIRYLEQRLANDLSSNAIFEGVPENYFRHYALEVFLQLVQSNSLTDRLEKFTPYVINIGRGGFELMTSDRPLIVSDGLHHCEAFVAMPIGPAQMLFLAEQRSVARRFVSRTAKQLSRAVNDAIVRQAENLVISRSGRQARYVERRLGVPDEPIAGPLTLPASSVSLGPLTMPPS
jgi:hypothetical protein